MTNKKIVIFGASDFAELMHLFFTEDSEYEVVAFTVDADYLEDDRFCDLPLVPFEEIEAHYPPDTHDFFVAMGLQDLNQQRTDKVAQARKKGYSIGHYLSSNARVHHSFEMTPNTVIMNDCILQPFVTIGENSVLWSTTRIGMKCQLGANLWIVGTMFGEKVIVGDNSFLGLTSVVAPNVKIGKRNVIGAGALILRDTHDEAVCKGKESLPSKVPSSRLRRI